MLPNTKSTRVLIIFLLCILFIATSAGIATAVTSSADQTEESELHSFSIILPLIYNQSYSITLTETWLTDPNSSPQIVYQSSYTMVHNLAGFSASGQPAPVELAIKHDGPCAQGLVYTATTQLPSGSWNQNLNIPAPDCTGVYTATTLLTYTYGAEQHQIQFLVNEPITPTYSTRHGFDRCTHPDPEDMQTWWNSSPYYVFNLYIGGIHYPSGCQNPAIDAYWVQEVAEQGWSFTAVWVGPQAPCSDFKYKMSSIPETAYTQGQSEALLAAEAARKLGLFGDLTIHYDVEGYSATTSCRQAVASFIQGWTDQLHTSGYFAGAYGSPCRSYISDWSTNTPTLDQVWIAHWYLNEGYDRTASVWNVPCGLTNDLWAQQQRLKQYSGDFSETWGGVTFGIDSNVFDTTVLSIPHSTVSTLAAPEDFYQASDPKIQDFELVHNDFGWVQLNGRLLVTSDNGISWSDHTPADLVIHSTSFLDAGRAWIFGATVPEQKSVIARSDNGGITWETTPFTPPGNFDAGLISAAYFDILDENTIFLSFKLQSGSAFSIGQLFASKDGGQTWEARTIPLGEPVRFTNDLVGTTAGGPGENEAYQTTDGGWTWEAVNLQIDNFEQSTFNLPENSLHFSAGDGSTAWAIIQEGTCSGDKGSGTCRQIQRLLTTQNGGISWTEISIPLLTSE